MISRNTAPIPAFYPQARTSPGTHLREFSMRPALLHDVLAGALALAACAGLAGAVQPSPTAAKPAPEPATAPAAPAEDAAARTALDRSLAAVQKLSALSYKAKLEGDWSAEGGVEGGGTYSVALQKADAGGWMIRILGSHTPVDGPAREADAAFDSITARSIARADKTITEMAAVDLTEARGFFAGQSVAAPVLWGWLAGGVAFEGFTASGLSEHDISGELCDVVVLMRTVEPVTDAGVKDAAPRLERLRVAIAKGDALPRRIEWTSTPRGDGTRAGIRRMIMLEAVEADRPVAASSFVPAAPEGYTVKPLPSPSQQARRQRDAERREAQQRDREQRQTRRPARAAGPELGKPAPDFAHKTPEGDEVTLASLRGKVVLLDFWATWCTPCIKAMPTMQEFHETYADRGLVVLGMNTWERGDPVKFKKDKGYTYQTLLKTDDAAKAYALGGIPTFFIIDREGNLARTVSGWGGAASKREMKQAIEKALAGGKN
jgi:thiol-disulfide isomerase/thioredoxin